jgi:hypothetical protein
MPVTKDSPLVEFRKKIVNKKPSSPAKPKKESTEKPKHVPSVIPAAEFESSIKRASVLCDQLIKTKKALKTGKELPGNYKRDARELGMLLSNIVTTIRSTATVILDAQTKAQTLAGSKLPKEVLHAAEQVLKQLRGSHRRIKQLNDDFGVELKKSKRGLEPSVIKNFLPEIEDIYNTADTARIDASKLYKQWSEALSVRPSPVKSAIPAFVSAPSLTQVGEATRPADKKTLDKLVKARNLGAVDFPNPYSVLWDYYSDKHMVLDNDVRNIIRFAVMYAAKTKPFPKQHSILELYRNGDLLKETSRGEAFDASDFNTNYYNAVKSLVKKMHKDPACKKFVFSLYERGDDNLFNAAINHLTREDSRGKSLVENARKQYIEACRNWFATYLPKL